MNETEQMLLRLTEKVERANTIQRSGGTLQPTDWGELYQLTNEAKSVLSKIEEADTLDPGDLTDEAYIEAARSEHQRDGELEIDDNAIISRGEDDGAYVQAWVWVTHNKVAGRN